MTTEQTSENDNNRTAAEQAVNSYRITQLESQLNAVKLQTEQLNFGQIKQMFAWLGLPVVVATGVFGVSLWQSIEASSISAAEERAAETINAVTGDISALQARIQEQQARSDQTVDDLIRSSAQADASADSARREATETRERAIEAERALEDLQRAAAVVSELQELLEDVTGLADRISENEQFVEIVLTRLTPLVRQSIGSETAAAMGPIEDAIFELQTEVGSNQILSVITVAEGRLVASASSQGVQYNRQNGIVTFQNIDNAEFIVVVGDFGANTPQLDYRTYTNFLHSYIGPNQFRIWETTLDTGPRNNAPTGFTALVIRIG